MFRCQITSKSNTMMFIIAVAYMAALKKVKSTFQRSFQKSSVPPLVTFVS